MPQRRLRRLLATAAAAAGCARAAPRPVLTVPLQEYVSVFEAHDQHRQEQQPSQLRHRIHVSEYYGRIAMGDPPQTFDVVFDTGSGNVVLPTVECVDEACQSHRRYASQRSRTAVQLALDDGTPMRPGDLRDTTTITYGTGRLTGEYIRDDLCLGGSAQDGSTRVCTTVDFLGVTQESRFPFSELPFDGILGLGLAGLSAGPNFNLVMRMKANGTAPDPVFAVFLRDLQADEDSEITFGSYRSERLAQGEEGLHWLPMAGSEAEQKGYWTVTMRDIFVRGQPLGLCNDPSSRQRCRVALDTGSSLMMGPPGQVERLLQAIGPCGSSLPAMRLQFDSVAGGTFDMVLGGEDYAEVSSDNCALAIQAIELPPTLGPMWVLGQTALRRYYSVYDAKRWRVGVGLARHTVVKRAPASAQPSGLAKAGEVCEDEDRNMAWNHLPGCHTFAAMGYCERFAPLAHRYCRLSCELCTLRGPAAQAPGTVAAPPASAAADPPSLAAEASPSSSGIRPPGEQEAFGGWAVPSDALKDVHGEDGVGARVGQGFRVSREQRGIIRRVSRSGALPTHQSWLLSR